MILKPVYKIFISLKEAERRIIMRRKKQINCEPITDAELDIMRVLWQTGHPMRVSEIVEKLSETRSWKTQTAHVLLGRLEEKGFVNADRSGYYHTFSAKIKETDYFLSESSALMKKVGGSVKSMVVSMIDAEGISNEELAELTSILETKCKELGIERGT